MAATTNSERAPAAASARALVAIVPPVEIMSSMIKQDRPRTFANDVCDLGFCSALPSLVQHDEREPEAPRVLRRHSDAACIR